MTRTIEKRWPDRKSGPYLATLTFGVLDDGQVTCIQVGVHTVDGGRVPAAAALRNIPLSTMLDEILREGLLADMVIPVANENEKVEK